MFTLSRLSSDEARSTGLELGLVCVGGLVVVEAVGVTLPSSHPYEEGGNLFLSVDNKLLQLLSFHNFQILL